MRSRRAPLAGSGSRGVCSARRSVALLADEPDGSGGWGSTVGKVIIGTDPHKRSATIEVRDEREILLATGRFGMDKTGYRQLLGYARGVATAAVGGGGRERNRTAAGRQVA